MTTTTPSPASPSTGRSGRRRDRRPVQTSAVRRLIPLTLLPLGLVAVVVANALWLRAYPSSVLAVPLFGAALLSVLLPVVIVGIGVRRLWVTALIDVVAFVFFTTLVALRHPTGLGDLYDGLVHAPAQILTFALPLVSPRTLLVAPIALCWLCGAIFGECVARGWQTVVPYATMIVCFGLAYGGTARAISSASAGRRYDTLLAVGLLLTLLLLRAVQAWIAQDEAAETTQPDGVLPLRGLGVGIGIAVLVAALAAATVQAGIFAATPKAPARTAPLDRTAPLTPINFIADLRPDDPRSTGQPLFSVTLGSRSSRYIAIADLDLYDGSSWAFDRTFRPSGGVVPADTDPRMRPSGAPVDQQYTIQPGPLTTAPWMPFQYRPQKVSGAAIDIDAVSGMIVPAERLRAGSRFTVRSTVPISTFDTLSSDALPGSAPAQDTVLGALSASLSPVVQSLAKETNVPASSAVPYLQALARDLRANYALAGAPAGSASSGASSSPAGSTPARSTPRKSTPRRSTPRKSTPRKSTPRKSTPRRSTPRKSAPRRPASSTKARPSRPRSSSRTRAGNFVAPREVAPTTRRPTSARRSPTPARSVTPSPTPSPSPSSGSPAAVTPSSTSGTGRFGSTGLADVLSSILGPARSASPEQYATLVALIARQLQLPARVVTGFRLPSSSPTASPGTYQVTSGDTWTWVEIPIAGRGWVVLDAAPGSYGNRKAQPTVSAAPTQPPSPSAGARGVVTASASNGNAVAPKSRTPRSQGTSGRSIMLWSAIVLAVLLLLALIAPLLRKRVRLRRRRAGGDPRRRVIGAWQESLDVLQESGLPDLTYLTSAEVAAATHERFGGEPGAQVRYIGDAANTAIFSPTTWIGPGQADAAWQAQRVLRRSVRQRLPLRNRLLADLRYNRPYPARRLLRPSRWRATPRPPVAKSRRGRHSASGRRKP